MKVLSLNEIHKSQIETMMIFREFCEKNNLKYYLAFGTLLGAVRHKGFIPWDDDVDIYMPRDDYDFLIRHFNEHIINNREVISKEINPEFYLVFAKIIDRHTVVLEKGKTFELGVWVDIFPMDYVIEDKVLCRRLNLHIGILNQLCLYTSLIPEKRRPFYKNLIIKVIKTIFSSNEKLCEKREEYVSSLGSIGHSNNYGLLCYRSGIWGIPIAPKEMFEPSVKLEFEGELFDAPRKYKKILAYCYGRDYMKLPPEKKRMRHSNTCYWKEDLNE